MINRGLDYLLTLTGRERLLLALLVGVVLPVSAAFLIVRPLQDQRQAAEHAQIDAVALQRWVSSQSGDMEALMRNAAKETAGAPIGSGGIEQGLITAQLRRSVTALDADGENGVEVQFDRVDFLKLAAWLRSAHPEWGYEIVAFRLEDTEEPGVVSAWLDLRPPKE